MKLFNWWSEKQTLEQRIEERGRAIAFVAGYRTAQLWFGHGPQLFEHEERERLNAIKYGFELAKRKPMS
jgi:hypothetical protein